MKRNIVLLLLFTLVLCLNVEAGERIYFRTSTSVENLTVTARYRGSSYRTNGNPKKWYYCSANAWQKRLELWSKRKAKVYGTTKYKGNGWAGIVCNGKVNRTVGGSRPTIWLSEGGRKDERVGWFLFSRTEVIECSAWKDIQFNAADVGTYVLKSEVFEGWSNSGYTIGLHLGNAQSSGGLEWGEEGYQGPLVHRPMDDYTFTVSLEHDPADAREGESCGSESGNNDGAQQNYRRSLAHAPAAPRNNGCVNNTTYNWCSDTGSCTTRSRSGVPGECGHNYCCCAPPVAPFIMAAAVPAAPVPVPAVRAAVPVVVVPAAVRVVVQVAVVVPVPAVPVPTASVGIRGLAPVPAPAAVFHPAEPHTKALVREDILTGTATPAR